jgi:hypothetical protein
MDTRLPGEITPPHSSPAARERERLATFIDNVNGEHPLSREAREGQGGGRAA